MITNHELMDKFAELGLPLVGVFNKDELPKRTYDGCYVINLQDSYDIKGNLNPGTHWTCFLIENDQACYFDSFGTSPPIEVQIFLNMFRPYAYNVLHVQNIYSGVCGYYVLAFCHFMKNNQRIKSLENRMKKFLDMFSEDPKKNKKILEKYLAPL